MTAGRGYREQPGKRGQHHDRHVRQSQTAREDEGRRDRDDGCGDRRRPCPDEASTRVVDKRYGQHTAKGRDEASGEDRVVQPSVHGRCCPDEHRGLPVLGHRKPQRVRRRRFGKAGRPADVDGLVDKRGERVKPHEQHDGAHRDCGNTNGSRRDRAQLIRVQEPAQSRPCQVHVIDPACCPSGNVGILASCEALSVRSLAAGPLSRDARSVA